LFIFLFVSFVAGQNAGGSGSLNIGGVGSAVGNVTGAALTGEIQIPDVWKPVVRVVLGLKDKDSVSFQTLVILSAIWISLFFILQNAFEALSLFSNKLMSWVIALVVSLILGITGAIKESSIFIFDLLSIFSFLEKNPIIQLIVFLALAIVVVFAVVWYSKKSKRDSDVQRAAVFGRKTGTYAARLEKSAEAQTGEKIG